MRRGGNVARTPGRVTLSCKVGQTAAVAVTQLHEAGCKCDGQLVNPLLLEAAKLLGLPLEGATVPSPSWTATSRAFEALILQMQVYMDQQLPRPAIL